MADLMSAGARFPMWKSRGYLLRGSKPKTLTPCSKTGRNLIRVAGNKPRTPCNSVEATIAPLRDGVRNGPIDATTARPRSPRTQAQHPFARVARAPCFRRDRLAGRTNHSAPALRQSRLLRLNHLTSAGLQVVVVVDVVASGGLEETGASADIGAAGFVPAAPPPLLLCAWTP
jgi:hypothetical protein